MTNPDNHGRPNEKGPYVTKLLTEILKVLTTLATLGGFFPKARPSPTARAVLLLLAAALLAILIMIAGCAAETNIAAGGYVGHWDTHVYMVKTAEVPAPALPGERPPEWTRSSSTTAPASH